MPTKRTERVQVLLTKHQLKQVQEVAQQLGWTVTGIYRLGWSLLHRILRDGKDVCKEGCVAKQALGLLRDRGLFDRDLRGKSTLTQAVLDSNPPERAGAITQRMNRREKPRKPH